MIHLLFILYDIILFINHSFDLSPFSFHKTRF